MERPVVATLTSALDKKHPVARGHSQRVAALAETVATLLGWSGARIARIRLAGLLHDVGKLFVPVGVLAKPGVLDPSEQMQVRAHPAAGAALLRGVPEARAVLASVLYHHERWDGRGYPAGIARATIPADARLLAIADAFDAMTSFRPYTHRLPHDAALEEIARCAGTQFDPHLAEAALAAWSEPRALAS